MTSRAKAIASLSGVFLLGAVIGALLVGIIIRDRAYEAERFRQREGFEMYIVDRLRLTEAQRDSLKDELERTFAELDELRFNTATEYRVLLDTLKQRISPQLTAEQRALLSDMDLNFRRGFPGKRHGGPPPHPPLGFRPPPEEERPLSQSTPSVPGDSVKHSAVTAAPKGEQPKEHEQTIASKQADVLPPDESPVQTPIPPSPQLGLADALRPRLDLNDTQYQQVRTIISEARDRLDRAKTAFASDSLKLRVAYRRTIGEMNRRIENVLTPEQLTTYQKLRPKKRR
jgi:hypothetical protein